MSMSFVHHISIYIGPPAPRRRKLTWLRAGGIGSRHAHRVPCPAEVPGPSGALRRPADGAAADRGDAPCRTYGFRRLAVSQLRGFAGRFQRSGGPPARPRPRELAADWRAANASRSVLLLPSLLQGAGFPRPAPVGRVRYSLCDRGSFVLLAPPDRTLGRSAGGRRARAAAGEPQSLLHASATSTGCWGSSAEDRLAMLPPFIDTSPFTSPRRARCRPA